MIWGMAVVFIAVANTVLYTSSPLAVSTVLFIGFNYIHVTPVNGQPLCQTYFEYIYMNIYLFPQIKTSGGVM